MKKLYFCKQLVAETDRKTADYQDVRDWLRHDTPRDNSLKPPIRGLFFSLGIGRQGFCFFPFLSLQHRRIGHLFSSHI